jgi:hypothetical protein
MNPRENPGGEKRGNWCVLFLKEFSSTSLWGFLINCVIAKIWDSNFALLKLKYYTSNLLVLSELAFLKAFQIEVWVACVQTKCVRESLCVWWRFLVLVTWIFHRFVKNSLFQ